MKKILLSFVPILNAFISCASKPSDAFFKNDVMCAMIYDLDNNPVQNAQIYCDGEFLGTSDMQGRFSIRGRKNEICIVEIEKPLHEKLVEKITFNPLEIAYFKMGTAEQFFCLARENLSFGKIDSAYEYCQKAIKLDENRNDIAYLYALLLYKKNQFEQSNKVLSKLENKQNFKKFVEELKRRNNKHSG